MDKYAPPYEVTEEMLLLVSEITECLGNLLPLGELERLPRLRRVNRVLSVQSSLAIERNSLSIEQASLVLEGRRVLAPLEDVLAMENAFAAYRMLPGLDPFSLDDLKKAHGTMMKGLVRETGRFRTGPVGVFDGEGRPVLLITAGDDSRPYNNSNQNVALAVAKDYSDPCLTEWEIGDYAVVQTSQMGTAGEFRDAQAFGIGNERYMVVGGASDGRGTAHVFKTTSDALTDWQYMGQLFTPSVYKSEYGTVWEMPNLVPLPYEDGRQSGKYLFVFSPQHGDNDVAGGT